GAAGAARSSARLHRHRGRRHGRRPARVSRSPAARAGGGGRLAGRVPPARRVALRLGALRRRSRSGAPRPRRGGSRASMTSVVHVITRLTMGGSSENTVSTIEALERAGYSSTLLLGPESEPPTVEDARRRGCRIVEVEPLGREVHPARDVAA